MPEIVKERDQLVGNLDDNSKKCLNNLCEVLENLQQKVDMSLQFDFQNIPNTKEGIEYSAIGGGKVASTGIFAGAPSTAFQRGPAPSSGQSEPQYDSMNAYFGK
jgi:hypothetical protein